MYNVTVTRKITRISYVPRFLEIGFEISACPNSVYQAFLLPVLKCLGTRLGERLYSTIALHNEKGQCNDLVPPIQAHMYSMGLGRTHQDERPAYISTVGLLKLQSSTEQIE